MWIDDSADFDAQELLQRRRLSKSTRARSIRGARLEGR
jgi:hypothetical protein